jgi:glutamate synthase (NADPH/NADH) large chain
MTGGVVVVLGGTGRNFAAGMSGGVAYVFDEDGSFAHRLNHAMVKLEKVAASDGVEHADMPRQRSVSVSDPGMGDLLRFDAERLRILVERHLLHTGSARAKTLLDNWDAALAKFVKVMPTDYAKALADLKARSAIAAE